MINSRAITFARAFLKTAEGCKLTACPDIGGVLTNGYGNTNNVVKGTITQEQADADLESNIIRACTKLLSVVKETQLAKLYDHEVAALISFVFNCGAGNWNIWKLLNFDHIPIEQIPHEIARFDHAHINGKLVEVPGLANRRAAEIHLWNTADVQEAAAIIPLNVDVSTSTLQVVPAPNPEILKQSNKAMAGVTTATVLSGVSILGVKFGINPDILRLLVGFTIGCIFILIIAVILYFRREKVEVKKVEEVKLKFTVNVDPIKKEFEMASAAFTQALQNLKNAYEAKIAAAAQNVDSTVATLQSQLDAANKQVADLQAQLNNKDAEDTAAVVAATPQ